MKWKVVWAAEDGSKVAVRAVSRNVRETTEKYATLSTLPGVEGQIDVITKEYAESFNGQPYPPGTADGKFWLLHVVLPVVGGSYKEGDTLDDDAVTAMAGG
jgi:hypothetical protein